MKMLIGAVVLCLFTGAGLADDWSPADVKRQTALTLLLAVDAYQTVQIQDHDNIREVGPVASRVLGDNPETLETVVYFTAVAAAHALVSHHLKPKYRKYWQIGGLLGEGYVISNNWRLGLRF